MGQSPPHCVSLRLPQRGCGPQSKLSDHRRVTKASLGTLQVTQRPRWNSSMNWLQGDMNPATGDIAYPISEEQKL
jgi:hypothetical protein